MSLVLLLMAAAIVTGAVFTALGRFGEMLRVGADYTPLELGGLTAADVALLRPPMSLWGYNPAATEEALQVIARSVTARDVEIATLRRELNYFRHGGAAAGSQGPGSGE